LITNFITAVSGKLQKEISRVDCVFCKISEGKLPAEFVLKEDDVFAIKDLHPVAPTHILIVPRKHVPSLTELDIIGSGDSVTDDSKLVSKMIAAAIKVAEKVSLSNRGFRLVWNCRGEGGQTVDHIHLHLLGGRQMRWPPG
jgi:histidine triad (HIT) family protein